MGTEQQVNQMTAADLAELFGADYLTKLLISDKAASTGKFLADTLAVADQCVELGRADEE